MAGECEREDAVEAECDHVPFLGRARRELVRDIGKTNPPSEPEAEAESDAKPPGVTGATTACGMDGSLADMP